MDEEIVSFYFIFFLLLRQQLLQFTIRIPCKKSTDLTYLQYLFLMLANILQLGQNLLCFISLCACLVAKKLLTCARFQLLSVFQLPMLQAFEGRGCHTSNGCQVSQLPYPDDMFSLFSIPVCVCVRVQLASANHIFFGHFIAKYWQQLLPPLPLCCYQQQQQLFVRLSCFIFHCCTEPIIILLYYFLQFCFFFCAGKPFVIASAIIGAFWHLQLLVVLYLELRSSSLTSDHFGQHPHTLTFVGLFVFVTYILYCQFYSYHHHRCRGSLPVHRYALYAGHCVKCV